MSSVFRLVAEALGTIGIMVVLAAVLAVPFGAADARRPPQTTHLVVPAAADATSPLPSDARTLRVCADPNNLPFSNERGEGFENAVAAEIANDLGRTVDYYWQPQRRGFMRTTLKAGRCDVVMSVPSAFEMARPTRPYYRSSYVFVTRADRRMRLRTFDDPRLRSMRIGIQMTGEDYETPPPAHALAARHLTDRVRGYMVYGDYSTPEPQRAVVDAVAAGDIDAAVVWGPVAGYFAAREPVALDLRPVEATRGSSAVPFVFDLSVGVRRDDEALHAAVERALAHRREAIRRILERFHVPLVQEGAL
jgi:quinoprotein dehydrogenase-associated probable ABC transporter substrate-binding protein